MMIALDKQKEFFKNHVATFSDYGNIKILDFKNPESSSYRIRFLFEEDYYRLHISGDLGELIASNYCNMTYEKFSDFVDDVGYFREKIDCHSRAIVFYDEAEAKKDILELFEEFDCLDNIIITSDAPWLETDEEKIEEAISDILEDFSEDSGIGTKGYEELSKHIDDAWEVVSNIGKRPTGILNLYMLAFKLAQEQLNNKAKS